ncbi:MAG: ATP-dependent DNA helicase RecG [Candidatus Omnitrophica bacterium]|nr:ATP-dependent DNA helicase RecG [Candidatus Omnitrophota bacterium]
MPVTQAPPLQRAIRYVKGVGPARAAQLAQMGVVTVEDALYFAPRRYEDRRRLSTLREAPPGELVTLRVQVLARSLRRIRGGRTLVEASVGDASGVGSAVWFNQPYLAQQLRVGEEVLLYGRLEPGSRPGPPSARAGAGRQLIHPELEHLDGGEEDSLHTGRIVPVYPLIAGVNQRWLRRLLAGLVEQDSGLLDDSLPEPLRAAKGWPPLPQAIRELHAPSSFEALEIARARLAFGELLLLQLALAQRRARARHKTKPQRYQLDGPLTQALRQRLPFRLTDAQERVLRECCGDLDRRHPMYRLLQGDVGCGKTIVMVFLLAAAAQSGAQAAVMAPTELLAEQHARVIAGLLGPLGVSSTLLAQGLAPAERRERLQAIASGEAAVVIGTHALIQQEVAFKRLALVVIDEQHKFGVVQRARLAGKAQEPDVLVMTATPIPRTLALTMYGDLDISTIDELPPGRGRTTTQWLREAQRDELYALVRRELAKGRQGYVVYPLIEERSTVALRAASRMAKHLQQEIFPEVKVALLHGQMKPAVKERLMQAFLRGQIQLLVSTVIVEVGLDVPNASVMVIEHPERFGLAQLHQLRGRIGRSTYPACCLLVSDSAEDAARSRLQAFVETTDGFRLAEHDLALRGPGELLGRMQHGWWRLRLADVTRDRALLEAARQEAQALIAQDPDLREPAVAALREQLARFRQRPG